MMDRAYTSLKDAIPHTSPTDLLCIGMSIMYLTVDGDDSKTVAAKLEVTVEFVDDLLNWWDEQ